MHIPRHTVIVFGSRNSSFMFILCKGLNWAVGGRLVTCPAKQYRRRHQESVRY